MIIINSAVQKFLKVIEAGWEALLGGVEPAEASDLRDNWLQFHWELLVEGTLQEAGHRICLFAYGDGAETESGRIFPPHDAPLYAVFCVAREGDKLLDLMSGKMLEVPATGFRFERFASGKQGYYSLGVPLNSIVVDRSYEEEPILLQLADIDFHIAPLEANLKHR